MLGRLERWAQAATQALAALGLGLLVFYAVMTLTDGTLRSLANSPIDAVRDVGGLICAVAIACCFPLAFLQRANITIRFVGLFFGRRTSQILDAIAAAAVEAAIIVIAWRLLKYAFQVRSAGDITFMLAVPIAPFWLTASTLIAITAPVQALVLALAIARCFGREPVSGAAGGMELS
jgi:TRAP-type transport system small permease protein